MSMFEINLVPDVKRQLLHTISMKRLMMFISIFVVAAAGGVVFLMVSFIGGQAIIQGGNEAKIKEKYDSISGYQSVDTILTLQHQLDRIEAIFADKKQASRIFSVLDVMLPTGLYQVRLSNMSVAFASSQFTIEGQAESATGNDYEALQAFEETVKRVTFDHGRYYDKEGNIIPTICITEKADDIGSIYGRYSKTECDDLLKPRSGNESEDVPVVNAEEGDGSEDVEPADVVRIRRYSILNYKSADDVKTDNKGYYFESACGAYEERLPTRANRPVDHRDPSTFRTVIRSTCSLSSPLQVFDRSSGRNAATGVLVLRFSARFELNPKLFEKGSDHIVAIGPERQNVTASYTQIRDMFEEKARDCEPDDEQCLAANRGNN